MEADKDDGLKPDQKIVVLEPGEVAVILREDRQRLEPELVLSCDIEELFETGSDDDVLPYHVELAMALVTRIHSDTRYANTILRWYRAHLEKNPDEDHGLEVEEDIIRVGLRRGQVALVMRENEKGKIGSMVWSNAPAEVDGEYVQFGGLDAIAMKLMGKLKDEDFIRMVMGKKPRKHGA